MPYTPSRPHPKKTVHEIVAKGHDYVMTVKGNTPRLHKAILAYEKQAKPPLDSWSWEQTGHGHDSSCRVKLWEASQEMAEEWEGLRYFVTVRRQGERDGKAFNTITCYISSVDGKAYRHASLIRGHRRIENNLHWVKDVVMNEDDCGIEEPKPAATLGIFRDIAFNLLVFQGYRSISTGMNAMGERVQPMLEIMRATMPQLLQIQKLACAKKTSAKRKVNSNQRVI